MASTKITFAPGTKLGDEDYRRFGSSKSPTFNIRPTRKSNRPKSLVKPPPSTKPTLSYQTTSQLDFRDPHDIYLSATSGVNQNLMKRSLSVNGELSRANEIIQRRRLLSARSEPPGIGGQGTVYQGYSYQAHKRLRPASPVSLTMSDILHETRLLNWANASEQRNVYFKPLVGNTRDRWIESASTKPKATTKQNAKRPGGQKTIRFSDTVDVVPAGMPRFLERGPIGRPHSPTASSDQVYRRMQRAKTEFFDNVGSNNAFQTLGFNNMKRQRSSLSDFQTSMERTYRKQALVKELLN